MNVHRLKPSESDEWMRLRTELWPNCSAEKHQEEMAGILDNPRQEAVFVSTGLDGRLQGFVEVSIKSSAPGCETKPVGYLEGWYVEPAARRQGIGKALVAAAEEWARSEGCREMASDTEIENRISQVAHERIGYKEVERLVYLKKELPPIG